MRRTGNATNHIVICTFYTYNFKRRLKISVNITFEKKSLWYEHPATNFLLGYISNPYIKKLVFPAPSEAEKTSCAGQA